MRAWVLNLDAEYELAPGSYTPSRALQARLDAEAERVARTLPPGDRVVGRDPVPDLVSRCWCPTPRAIATLRAAGLSPPPAPSVDVLRRAHERGFAFDLAADELPGCARVTGLDELEAAVAGPGPTGAWMIKRAFGVAGRGLRTVRALSEADRAWVRAGLRQGALYVEPLVEIERELSMHGWVTPSRVHVTALREVVVAHRAFVESRLADLDPTTERALVHAAERVGAALQAAGYHGPFGVDAYEHRTASGAIALRTLSEVNPRYCMGWGDPEGWDPP